jgi:hypothetical protein
MVAERPIAARAALAAACVVVILIAFLAGRETAGGERAAVVPGPDRVVDGITVGFADTDVGAEAAAAHYLLEIERAMDTLSVQRTATVAGLVATSTDAHGIEAHAASVIALERSHGAPLRRVAVSTDLVSYSPAAAQITVLEDWFYATSSEEALWAIERVSLAWRHGDWRVSAIAGAAPSANESLADLRGQLMFPGSGDASVR